VVPQLFLRGFGQELCEHDRDGTVRNVTVKRAAVIRDAYATADGSMIDDSLESWLGRQIESPAAGVVRALRRGVVPSGDDLVSASAFVAFQMVRGPSFRRRLAELATTIGPLLFATMASSKAIKKTPDLFANDDELARISRKVMEMAPPEVRETKKDADLRDMLRGADMLTTALAGMNWSIASANQRLLITGDAPAILRNAYGDFFRGPQLLPEDYEVVMPVSPSRLLSVSPFPMLGDQALLTQSFASEINNMLVRACHARVYHHLSMQCYVVPPMPRTPESLPTPTVRFNRTPPGSPAPTPPTWPTVGEAFRQALNLLGGDPTLDDW
jgi:hypothetical protein